MKYQLMAPGPVPLAPIVKKILAEDILHHRTPLFQECLKSVYHNLPLIFENDGPVLLSTSSGTGAMEAAMLNFVKKGDKVLVVNSGKFGERWFEMAKTLGCDVIEYKVSWGKSVDLNEWETLLLEHPDLKAVCSQYCETSTGSLHPIHEMAKIKSKVLPDALFLVDAITAVLTCELKMKEWQIDVCTGGSQKAFMLPPGLSFIALSKKAEKRILKEKPSLYFDLKKEIEASKKEQTAYSSNVPLIRALDHVLKEILKEGKNEFILRLQKRALAVREALKEMGLSQFPENPAPALSVVNVPEGIDGKALRNHIEEKYQTTFMGGQEDLSGKIIRIGHMGYITKEDIKRAIQNLSQALKDFGYNSKEDKALQKIEEIL